MHLIIKISVFAFFFITGQDSLWGEQPTSLQGSGASFPAPLYQRWIAEFVTTHPRVQINYQATGSGAGIKNLIAGLVDFAGSDAALTHKEIAAISRGVVMIPATAGSIVLAYNLPGVSSLKLSRTAYAGIFLGKITQWNDPLILATNPGITLPPLPIMVATRSDGSGTTFAFTKHLSTIDAEFAKTVGFNKAVAWPTGMAGKGNDGVTSLVKQNPGTIGYVEYSYTVHNRLPFAELQNKSGIFVKATPESGLATISHTPLPPDLSAWPSDPSEPEDYPIVTFTWLLLYKKYHAPQKLNILKEFVSYGLTTGQSFAQKLGYIPLPPEIVTQAQAALETVH